jgi:hypothetical protein
MYTSLNNEFRNSSDTESSSEFETECTVLEEVPCTRIYAGDKCMILDIVIWHLEKGKA